MSLSMDERSMMTKEVLVESPVAGVSDSYGNETTTWTTVGPYKGFIERLEASSSGGEPTGEGGRNTGVVEWLAIVEATTEAGVDVTVTRLDRLSIDGRLFSISLVELLVSPSGIRHHYEVVCLEVS